jgi:hypothetical protein
MTRYVYPTLGAAVAVAGADKLGGLRSYRRLFRHLGWSRGQMQSLAAAEAVGGLLMALRPTRRIGGALVAGSSAAVLASEVGHRDSGLAALRGLVLIAGLAALLAP